MTSDPQTDRTPLAALRESEERYRLLVDHAPDAIFVHIDGRIALINDAGLALCGAASREQAIGMPVLNLVHPDYQELVRNRIRSAVEDKQSTPLMRQKWVRFDGSEVDVEVAGTPCVFGGQSAVQVIARDVTAQVKADARLRASEDMHQRILRAVPAGVIHVAADGVVLHANEEAVRIMGVSWNDLAGGRLQDYAGSMLHEDGLPCSADELPITQCLRTGMPQLGSTIGIRRPDGAVTWTDYSAIPVHDAQGGASNGAVAAFLDVTERLEKRAALQHERDFIAAVLDTIGALVIVLGRDGRIVRFNAACSALSGYMAEEVYGLQFWNLLLAPDEAEGVRLVWNQLLNGRFPLRHENDWVTRDGTRRRIAWSNTAVTNTDGEVSYVIGTGIDVTRERLAEAERRKSEALFESLIENLPFDVWARDMQDRCIAQNSVARARWGDQRGRTPDNVNLPGDTLEAWHRHNELVRGGQTVRTVMQYAHNGETRQYDKILAPIRDGDAIRGTVGVNIDITQSKATEEALRRSHEELERRVRERTAELEQANELLKREVAERARAEWRSRESENQLRAILDHTTAVIYVKNIEGRYLLINKRYEELFHVSRADVVGKTDFDLFPRETAEAVTRNDRQVSDTNAQIEFEEYVPHDDGEVHAYISIKVPLQDPGGRCYAVCGISTDITDRRRAADLARKHRDELAHAARLGVAGQLAALTAHELSQPLNAIGNYTKGCLNYMRSGGATVAELEAKLESVVTQADRAGKFIGRIRDLVRKSPAPPAELAVNDPVRAAIEVVEPRLRDARTQLVTQLAEPSPWVVADAIQIEQVVINLLLNGVDAMLHLPEPARVLTIRTQVAASGMAEFAVRDVGTGVAEELSALIFDQFFTTKANGLGLGLSMSRGIMASHNGHIGFANHPGGGATFFGLLPCVEPPA